MHPSIKVLAEHVQFLGTGPLQDGGEWLSFLIAAWPHLRGSADGGMHADKVHRLESPQWNPPVLSFKTERHGGTVHGSTRAEMQHWEVDVGLGTAELVRNTHRQLHSMASRWSPQPLASELAEAIKNGKDHAKLRWRKKGTVALTGDAVPDGFKQTVRGRKKRLIAALDQKLGTDWREKIWRTPV